MAGLRETNLGSNLFIFVANNILCQLVSLARLFPPLLLAYDISPGGRRLRIDCCFIRENLCYGLACVQRGANIPTPHSRVSVSHEIPSHHHLRVFSI